MVLAGAVVAGRIRWLDPVRPIIDPEPEPGEPVIGAVEVSIGALLAFGDDEDDGCNGTLVSNGASNWRRRRGTMRGTTITGQCET